MEVSASEKDNLYKEVQKIGTEELEIKEEVHNIYREVDICLKK